MGYTVVRERGKGGFGVVNEVVDEQGNHFACKVLNVPPHLPVELVKPRFEREVKYQSAIRHNHVVHIFEHHLDSNPPWFIMPLADWSFEDEIEKDRTCGGDPRIPLFHILAGLEEIHRLGYCHRDLKPGNVLRFTGPDGGPLYALSDFGLMAVGEDASSTLTPSGIGGGTQAYQAPECAINFKRATGRSDIYSFGAMLHDIFAPNPKRLPHIELTAPGAIGPVIEKCTKKNPHRRFKNVEELREALFEALHDYQFQFESNEEEALVGILMREDVLPTTDEWDQIFDFLDATPDKGQPTANIFRALRREHIDQLNEHDPDLMDALGKMFANHCRTRSFDFDYCDVLAAKGQLFYDYGELGLKASIAIGLLVLGTEHNRWFVERKFVAMAGPQVSDALAQRIVVEMSVLNVDFRGEFDALAHSISINQYAVHPHLQELLA